MDRWYTWVDNQMYGPYQPDQLSEFVKPDTMLCREGTEEWKSAKEFPELGILFSGLQVEPPPNVGWMVKHGNSTTPVGPFPKAKLTEMIETGEVGPNDFVKHSDWDDWELLRKTKLVEHDQPTEPSAQPPSPEGFLKVVRESSNPDLLREYNNNYKLYARRERKILKEELLRRGLIKKTLGLF